MTNQIDITADELFVVERAVSDLGLTPSDDIVLTKNSVVEALQDGMDLFVYTAEEKAALKEALISIVKQEAIQTVAEASHAPSFDNDDADAAAKTVGLAVCSAALDPIVVRAYERYKDGDDISMQFQFMVEATRKVGSFCGTSSNPTSTETQEAHRRWERLVESYADKCVPYVREVVEVNKLLL